MQTNLLSDSLIIYFNKDSIVVPVVINPNLVDVINDKDKLTIFNLSQNYPNPFNPTTKIKYSIPSVETRHASSVQLVVYDLVNRKQRPGNYEVEFDGSKLASGVYFYKLTAGNYSAVKKLILMK